MKGKIFHNIALWLVVPCVITACSNDNDPELDKGIVSSAPDFVDSRDGHVYKCVKIGNQIWLAENFAYYLDNGSYEGCYTWNEPTLKLAEVALPDEVFAQTLVDLVDDPTHDWSVEEPKLNTTRVKQYPSWMTQYGYTQDRILSMLVNYKVFLACLNEKLDEQKPYYIAPAAKAHMEAQEEKNGNYSEKYGFLYSLDAALKSVPEGWRLPSDQDWKKLEKALGMSDEDIEQINAWRGQGCGDFLKEGGLAMFGVKWAGCNAWTAGNSMQYIKQNECAYFWTSEDKTEIKETTNESGSGSDSPTEVTETRYGMIRQIASYSPMIWRGTTIVENVYRPTLYSVRLVKDI